MRHAMNGAQFCPCSSELILLCISVTSWPYPTIIATLSKFTSQILDSRAVADSYTLHKSCSDQIEDREEEREKSDQRELRNREEIIALFLQGRSSEHIPEFEMNISAMNSVIYW